MSSSSTTDLDYENIITRVSNAGIASPVTPKTTKVRSPMNAPLNTRRRRCYGPGVFAPKALDFGN